MNNKISGSVTLSTEAYKSDSKLLKKQMLTHSWWWFIKVSQGRYLGSWTSPLYQLEQMNLLELKISRTLMFFWKRILYNYFSLLFTQREKHVFLTDFPSNLHSVTCFDDLGDYSILGFCRITTNYEKTCSIAIFWNYFWISLGKNWLMLWLS